MKKLAHLLFILFVVHFTYAQSNDRIRISGSINVPVGEDPQGISVFNINSQEGTISNSEGKFAISVAENDSIKVFAVQFQEFMVVIDSRVLQTKTLNIYVNELVNRLPEVIVSPYDLTGELGVDVEKLEVINLPVKVKVGIPDGLYANVENVVDFGKAPKNKALEFNQTRLVNGLNFVNLFKLLLISNKQNDISNPYSKSYKEIDLELRRMYNDDFFKENFEIELKDIPDFILYADRNGLDEEMLRKGNELDLIDFLMEQSKKYKRQLDKNNHYSNSMRIETYLKVISLLLFTVSPLMAQENTILRGTISAPLLGEASVNIINSTQRTGTVNSYSGSFQILVRENDELLFSSIQYTNVSIRITSEIIKTGILNITLEEDLNVLDEVNISNLNLTGNIATDISSMNIVRDMPVNIKFGDIKNLIFESDINDPQKAPLNLALGERPGLPDADILGIIGLILSPILPDPKPAEIKLDLDKYKNNSDIIKHLRGLFDEKFFTETLAIKKDYIDEFIYYADDNGLGVILVKPKNQLALIEFLIDQSKNYRKDKSEKY